MSTEIGIGSVIGGYRVESFIGQGAMGAVYLAEDADGRQVALKLLVPELREDDRFRQRFLRESEVIAELDHPRVIPLVGAGDDAGRLYLAMAYVEGTDLRELLRHGGRLEAETTIELLDQVASALDAAHDNGVVHRDIKPGNILIGDSVDGRHAYVCDFGLAKHMASPGSLTGSRGFVGTIDYVSPEQIEGGTVDGRSDVYSLGCLLYECIAGVRPFDRESELAVVFAHLNEAPPLLTAQRPELPAAIDEVIRVALAKDPADRFRTCGELVRAAAAALTGKALPRRRGARGRVAALAGAVVLAAGAVTAALLLSSNGGHRTAPPTITPSAIDGLSLGKTNAAYKHLLGPVWREDIAQIPNMPLLIFQSRKLAVYFDKQGGTGVEITTWSPRFRTAAGIGPCSSVKELKRAYGSALKISKHNVQHGVVSAYTVGHLIFGTNLGAPFVTAVALYRSTRQFGLAVASFNVLNEAPCK